MSTWKFGSQVLCTGVLSRLGPDPVSPNCPYCHTILLKGSTRMTRLSGAPSGACGITPAGVPVPAINVYGPTRCTSLTPIIDLAVKLVGPSPNDQSMSPAVLI